MQTTKPDVQLRYRLGYYAPGGKEDGQPDTEDRITAVMSSPLDASGIGVRASVEPAAAQIALVVHIDPLDLNLKSKAGKWTGALHLQAVQTGATGERLDGISQAAEISLEQATYERALQQGLQFDMKLPRNPAAVAVRIVVVDDRGANVGSLSVPIAPVPANNLSPHQRARRYGR